VVYHPHGSSCSCTPNYGLDTLYIYDNVQLIDYQGTSAFISVEDGGKLSLTVWNTATTLGSGMTLIIRDGGKLTLKGNITNNSANVSIEGEWSTDYGVMVNNGTITSSDDSKWEIVDFTNNGTLNIGGEFEVDYGVLTNNGTIVAGANSELELLNVTNNGSFTANGELSVDYRTFTNSSTGTFTTGADSEIEMLNVNNSGLFTINGEFEADKDWVNFNNSGTLVINGTAEVKLGNFYNTGTTTNDGLIEQRKNWNVFSNSGSVNGNGVIDLKNNTTSNTGTINGCSNCTFEDPTYLVNFPTVTHSIWDDESWINGTPSSTRDVLIIDDYNENDDFTCRNLEVKSGTEFELKNGAVWRVEGTIKNNGTIQLSEEAMIVQTDDNAVNSGTGTYIVERKASNTDNEYNIWSSPVANQSILTFFEKDNLYDIFTFEAQFQDWKYDFATTTPSNDHAWAPFQFSAANLLTGADGVFDVGRGYFAPGNTKKREFEGKINNGPIYVNVETSNVTTPTSWGGNDWNVIGNPYPSSISTTSFLATNYNNGSGSIANAVYYWDDPSQAYITMNNTDSDVIGSCQGFWVAALNNGQVVFSNSMRSETYSDMRSNDLYKAAYLSMTNDQGTSEKVRVYLDYRASDTEDNVFDALKLENGSGYNFYSQLNGTNYVFQSVTDIALYEEKTISLGFTVPTAGLYSIGLDSLANMPANYGVYIQDLEKNITFDLRTKVHSTLMQILQAPTMIALFCALFTKKKRRKRVADKTLHRTQV